MIYQNVRGLKTKLLMWRNHLALCEHDLVAATETFLDDSVEDSELTIENWSVLRRDRGTPCGGVLLAARGNIVLRRRHDLETEFGEDLWADFKWRGRDYHVSVVYIKPSATEENYMQWFISVENIIHKLNGPVIILGDINLNSASLNINNYYCYFLTLCNFIENNAVVNLHGGKLDIVLVRKSDFVQEVLVTEIAGIVPIDAYHPALYIRVKTGVTQRPEAIPASNINPLTDWNFNKCDYAKLYYLLSCVSWDKVFLINDVPNAVKCFYEIFYGLFDACMPKKRRGKIKDHRYPIWFTHDIILDVKRKHKLHAAWKRNESDESYKRFQELRASLKLRVTLAYYAYMTQIESNINADPRQFWRHITNLRSRGGFEPIVAYKGETYSGIAAAEAFANFFSSVFSAEIPRLNPDVAIMEDTSRNGNSVDILGFDFSDVTAGINKLKANSSIGPDNIPPLIFKNARDSICHPLCHIFNLSLRTGVYPPQWKISRVTPIPKTSDKSNVEECRPIAILSTPAKVFENILHRYIYRQVEKYISDAQHGFRSKRSVNTNLLTVVNFISKALDCGQQVDVLYFDFKKAFDTVNNDVLIAKLSVIGFAPGLLKLLSDYLRDRQQFVRLGIYESTPYHTRSGVSQGSILGPLLFLLMINDLPTVLRHSECLLYADDLKLYAKIQSVADCLALQRDVSAVHEWSIVNKMEFNLSKCYVMTFGRRWHPILFDYKIGDTVISRTVIMKDLGVTFDQKLTFHEHIVTVAKESFQRLGFVLRNARDFKNNHVIRLLYNALVRSKLEASSCVWNPHEAAHELLLEKVQKAFLRALYKRKFGYYPFMYPTAFLLGCLNFNSLRTRRANEQLVMACKIIRGIIDAPGLFNELARFFVPNNYLRGRRHKLLAVPSSRTVAHACSPIPRTLSSLNKLLETYPNFDLFFDRWKEVLTVCLSFSENSQ